MKNESILSKIKNIMEELDSNIFLMEKESILRDNLDKIRKSCHEIAKELCSDNNIIEAADAAIDKIKSMSDEAFQKLIDKYYDENCYDISKIKIYFGYIPDNNYRNFLLDICNIDSYLEEYFNQEVRNSEEAHKFLIDCIKKNDDGYVLLGSNVEVYTSNSNFINCLDRQFVIDHLYYFNDEGEEVPFRDNELFMNEIEYTEIGSTCSMHMMGNYINDEEY